MNAISPVLPSSPQIPEVVLAKDQPEYIPLPVAVVDYSDGVRSLISSYRLSWRERLRILVRGRVWWEQLTFGQLLQPQKMYISEPLWHETVHGVSVPFCWDIRPKWLSRMKALYYALVGSPHLPRRSFWRYATWRLAR